MGDQVRTRRTVRYHVEILREDGWQRVHPPDWEQTDLLTVARPFAGEVRDANPDDQVRIIETDSVEITKERTGEVGWLGLGTKVQTYL